MEEIRAKMQQVLEFVRQDIGTIRTGRATPSLVEDIAVEAYGGTSRLRVMELSTITAPDTQSLLITPWDKSVIGEIKKGIEKANVGLNPIITGEAIRISLPLLTSEDREKYVKLLHQKLENSRIAIRQARQDGMHYIKKGFEDKEISEDQKVLQEKKLQEMTDEHMVKIEEMGKAKETDLRAFQISN